MLALTRRKDETIVIDGKIRIKVLDIIDGKVRLGVDAPKEVSIYREEVYLDIQQNNKKSTKTSKETIKALATLIKDIN